MPLHHVKIGHRGTYDAYAFAHPTLTPERKAEEGSAKLSLAKRKKAFNDAMNLGSALVGGEFGSFAVTKDALKNRKIEVATKLTGFSSRYVGGCVAYTARVTTGIIGVTNRTVHHLKASAALKTPFGSGVASAQTGFTGFYCAIQGIMAIKSSYNLLYDARADLIVQKDRTTFQREMSEYNPSTGKFRDVIGEEHADPQRLKRMQELLAKKHGFRATNAGDVSRTSTQVLTENLSKLSEWANRSTVCVSNALGMIPAGHFASTVVPGASVAVQGGLAVLHAYRATMNICAMHNVYDAMEKTENKALKALSVKVVDERAFVARARLINATGFAVMMGYNATLLAGTIAGAGVPLVGAPVLGLIGGAIMVPFYTAYSAYEYKHNADLDLARGEATANFKEEKLWENAPKSGRNQADILAKRSAYFTKLVERKNGWAFAELIALRMLRGSVGEEKEATVQWLRDLGFSEQAIVKIQLSPDEAEALKTLRLNLYSNKLIYKWRNNCHGFKAFKQIVGVTAVVNAYHRRQERKAEERMKRLMEHTISISA